MQTRFMTRWRSSFAVWTFLSVLLCAACGDPESTSVVLTADLPLHLEDHLDAATIEGSEVPTDVPEPVEWRFDEPQSRTGNRMTVRAALALLASARCLTSRDNSQPGKLNPSRSRRPTMPFG